MAKAGAKAAVDWQALLTSSNALKAPVVSVSSRRIASLWAGYGSVFELAVVTTSGGGTASVLTY